VATLGTNATERMVFIGQGRISVRRGLVDFVLNFRAE